MVIKQLGIDAPATRMDFPDVPAMTRNWGAPGPAGFGVAGVRVAVSKEGF